MSRLIIIHHSPVIRKGLLAMAKTVSGYSYLDHSMLNEIKGVDFSDKPTLVLCEACMNNTWSSDKLKDVKLIGISNGSDAPKEYEDFISEEIGEEDLGEILTGFLNSQGEDTKDKEDELSSREKDVLKLVAFGHTNKEIADKLFISVHTVVTHRKHITEKLGIKSISGLTVYAILNKIIDTSEINVEDLI